MHGACSGYCGLSRVRFYITLPYIPFALHLFSLALNPPIALSCEVLRMQYSLWESKGVNTLVESYLIDITNRSSDPRSRCLGISALPGNEKTYKLAGD